MTSTQPTTLRATEIEESSLVDLGFVPDRLSRVVASAQADIEAGLCDGVSLRVLRRGEVVQSFATGFAERVTGRELEENTVFGTQSVGKQFVHALVLSYVERGLLALHQPVADILPAFGARGKQRITLTHLLTHTSGLMSDIPPLPLNELGTQSVLAAYAMDSLLESRPGERVRYSVTCASAIMAELLLTIDGHSRSLTQFMNDELFAPLGMLDTSMGIRPDLADRLAPVTASFTGTGLFPASAIDRISGMLMTPGNEMASGAYVTTAADLSRFAEMLARGGELDGTRLLSPAMLDLATRNHTGELSNNLFDYTFTDRNWDPFPAYLGLGFFLRGEKITPGFIGTLASPRSFGGFGAGSTCFWVDPERELTFSLLTTGLMEESRHIERSRRLGDLVISSMA
jgi:CubicO group peptidase (beta-lactamase class C family)